VKEGRAGKKEKNWSWENKKVRHRNGGRTTKGRKGNSDRNLKQKPVNFKKKHFALVYGEKKP